MTAGRPPNWNPFADLDPTVWLEPVVLTSKDRLTLPVAVRRRLNWEGFSETSHLLATLRGDGSADLLPWHPNGEALLERLGRALSDAEPDNRANLVLAAMDRYLRVTLEGDGRATLPTSLIVHLGAHENDVIRLVVSGGKLRLWSEHNWREGRSQRSEELEAILSLV